MSPVNPFFDSTLCWKYLWKKCSFVYISKTLEESYANIYMKTKEEKNSLYQLHLSVVSLNVTNTYTYTHTHIHNKTKQKKTMYMNTHPHPPTTQTRTHTHTHQTHTHTHTHTLWELATDACKHRKSPKFGTAIATQMQQIMIMWIILKERAVLTSNACPHSIREWEFFYVCCPCTWWFLMISG